MIAAICTPLLLGLGVALGTGWLLVPILRRLKARQFISSDAPKRHQTKAGTPTMGGAIILVGGLLPALAYPLPGGVSRLSWAVALATLGFGVVGFLDDLLTIVRGRNLGLRAREKLLGQLIVAAAFTGWIQFNTASAPVELLSPGRLLLSAYHVLLLMGMSNAVNLTDGLDGLAGGVTVPVWLSLAVVGGLLPLAGSGATLLAGVTPDWGVVTLCAAFAGATLGYLWYNAHPAQVFMGDTGSLAVGGGIAAAAIALRLDWLVLLAALVPIVEAGSVTLQVISFKTTGRRIFRMSPLHHHFELCEWPETRIVARFAIASTLCSLAAMVLAFGR